MTLNEAYKKVCDEALKHPSIKNDLNPAILALHESATKIWEIGDRKDKINTRAASALISVFYIMRELGIDNPEECLIDKLEELKKESSL